MNYELETKRLLTLICGATMPRDDKLFIGTCLINSMDDERSAELMMPEDGHDHPTERAVGDAMSDDFMLEMSDFLDELVDKQPGPVRTDFTSTCTPNGDGTFDVTYHAVIVDANGEELFETDGSVTVDVPNPSFPSDEWQKQLALKEANARQWFNEQLDLLENDGDEDGLAGKYRAQLKAGKIEVRIITSRTE